MSKCDQCLNTRPIISENGWHRICALPAKQAALCITGKKIRFIPLKVSNKNDT